MELVLVWMEVLASLPDTMVPRCVPCGQEEAVDSVLAWVPELALVVGSVVP